MPGEKKVLSDEVLQDSYHGICFSANVAGWGRNWVSQFINTLDKPFFIDPMSYVVQFDLEKISKEGELKKSYVKLFEEYGEPFSPIINTKNHLSASDFDDRVLESFVTNVLEFQKNIAKPKGTSQQGLLEYAKLLGDATSVQEPEFLVAPYFWFDNTNSEWYKLNSKIMALAKNCSGNIPVYGVICVDMETIQNRDEVSKLVSDFSEMDGVLLWISELSEYNMNRDDLISYLNFLHQFNGNNTLLMYGGYFSMIASKFGLNGISPGVGISEFKSVRDQPTGGIFSNKYYIPQAKSMAVEADARSFCADNPEIMCTCNICDGTELNSVDDVHHFFDELTPLKAKQHYCLCRSLESKKIETSDENEIVSILSKNIEFCETKIGSSYNIPYRHLYTWQSAIKEFINIE